MYPIVKPDSVLSYTESKVLIVSCVRSQTKSPSSLSLWAVWVCGEPYSAIFFTESLSCVCVESQTQPSSSAESLSCVWRASLSYLLLLSSWAVSLWVRLSRHPLSLCAVHSYLGRLGKSLLSLWRRLGHPCTEFPCCVDIGERVRLSKSLLSHGSSSSANHCWVGGGRSS